MNEIYATPIVDGKYWVVEQNGVKIGTLQKKENNRFMLSSQDGRSFFGKKEELVKVFGKNFFINNRVKTTVSKDTEFEVYGYPTRCHPNNPMFNVQKRLPLFTKSIDSKSIYCAGYYIIKFGKGWVKSFCPKLITIDRYESKGPFKDDQEVKKALANVNSN